MNKYSLLLINFILCLFFISSCSSEDEPVIVTPDDIEEENTGFITVWNTISNNESVFIPVNSQFIYNYDVDWGDGKINTNVKGNITHVYEVPGDHVVSISGEFPAIYFNFDPEETQLIRDNRNKFMSIEQWGDIEWKSLKRAFSGCFFLQYNATDVPDLSQVTDLSYMFHYCSIGEVNLDNWDVGNIVNMSNMFSFSPGFNSILNSWNVSKVTDMSKMFDFASKFSGEIGNWDVSNVENMSGMFSKTELFNSNISSWNVGKVRDMSYMFSFASNFNGEIGNWNLVSATNLAGMFSSSGAFNQDIGNWNVSNCSDFSVMFSRAESFNASLGHWDISNAENLSAMLDQSALSTYNYDVTLKGWSELQSLPSNLSIGVQGLRYCAAGESARNILINEKDWDFRFDGKALEQDCY